MSIHTRELPCLVIDEAALQHNIETMAAYTTARGAVLAPHIKTHLAEAITRRQLEAGAWGVTVATPGQARWAAEYGARRIVVANEVLEPAGLDFLSGLDARGIWSACLVDSVDGVRAMDAALTRPLRVLVELGAEGGRCGARTSADGAAVASAVIDSFHLRLVGVECYEGVLPGADEADRLRRVDELLGRVGDLAIELDRAGAFAEQPILSAGGSAYFDRVAEIFGAVELVDARRPLVVLRAGAYVTHDHIAYQTLSPFGSRISGFQALRPAAELWARVLSRPEPELAIFGVGKRECPYDLDLPLVLRALAPSGELRDVAHAEVFAMNDHHTYCRLPVGSDIAVGDAVALGMSHPCTFFDKWDEIPILDSSGRTVEIAYPQVTCTHPDAERRIDPC